MPRRLGDIDLRRSMWEYKCYQYLPFKVIALNISTVLELENFLTTDLTTFDFLLVAKGSYLTPLRLTYFRN